MEHTTKSLTEYLKTASELECSIYRQEEAIKKASSEVKLVEPNQRKVAYPHDDAELLKKPEKPEFVSPKDEGEGSAIGTGVVLLILSVLITPIGIGSLVLYGADPLGIGLTIVGSACGGFGLLGVISVNSEKNKKFDKARKQLKVNMAKYEKDLAEYQIKCAEAKRKFTEKEEQYKAEVLKAEMEYENSLVVAKTNYQSALDEIEAMRTPLAETKELLNQLYANDWIYGKYRNMIAMTTMYEYFVTGRCSELAGPNGAYNLYEQEARQNIIISQLDSIGSQLEDIKANQYALYAELQETNRLVSGVVSELKLVNEGIVDLRDKTGAIVASTKAAAYYTEITAKNTEALKYIELVTQ